MHDLLKAFQYLFNYQSLYLKESIYRYTHGLEPYDKRMTTPLLLSLPVLFAIIGLALTRNRFLVAALNLFFVPTASSLFLLVQFERPKSSVLPLLFGLACFDRFYLVALLPSVLLLSDNKPRFTVLSLLTWAGLFVASAQLHDSDLFSNLAYTFKHTYLAQIDPDYHPNIGVWWYILQQMFDQYRPLYLAVMWSHLFVYQYPVMQMCKTAPKLALWLNLIIIYLFSPDPSLYDMGILWAQMTQFSHLHKYMKFSFICMATPIVLLPFAGITQYQWMKLFIGNANFVYAATLGWILVQGTAINDYLFAYKREQMEKALERVVLDEPLEIALML